VKSVLTNAERERALEMFAVGMDPTRIAVRLGLDARDVEKAIAAAEEAPANFYEAQLVAGGRALRRRAETPEIGKRMSRRRKAAALRALAGGPSLPCEDRGQRKPGRSRVGVAP
jgi:hypothetical protein